MKIVKVAAAVAVLLLVASPTYAARNFVQAGITKKLDHFDLVYGLRITATGKWLRVGEEFDPSYAYGKYGQNAPYGKYWVPLGAAFTAIDHTSYHGIIR